MDRDKNEADQTKKVVLSDESQHQEDLQNINMDPEQQTARHEDRQDINMDTDVPEDLSRSRNAAGSSLGTINQGASTSFHDPGSRNAAGSSVGIINQGASTSFQDSGSRNAAGSSVGAINQGASTSFQDPSTRGARYRISTVQVKPTSNSELGAQSENKNRGSDSSSSRRSIPNSIEWDHGASSPGSQRRMNCDSEVISVLNGISLLFTSKLLTIPSEFQHLTFKGARFHPEKSNIASKHGIEELIAFLRARRSENKDQNSESPKVSQGYTIEECQDSLIQDLEMDLWMLIEISILTLKQYENYIDFKQIQEYITCFEIMKEERVLKENRVYNLRERAVSEDIDNNRFDVTEKLLNLIDDCVGKMHYAIFIIKIHEQLSNDGLRQTAIGISRLDQAAMNFKDWQLPEKSGQKKRRKKTT